MKAPKLPAMPDIDFRALLADFRSLDPKDVGQWPLAPRVTMLVAMLLALLVAAWWVDWRGQNEQLDLKREEEVKLKEQYLSKMKQAVNLDEHRRQLAEIDRSFGAVLKQLPNKSEMEGLLIDINQAGLGQGLQFELFRPGAEAMKDFYAELPITIRVTGSYHDLGAFVGDVAKLPRIVLLGELGIAPAKDGRLAMDAIATTYRYLDDEEIARQKREKTAKKK